MDTKQVVKYQNKLIDMRNNILGRLGNLDADKKRKYGVLEADFAEQATQLMNDEVVDGLDDLERVELEKINRALIHIQHNRYGICDECGETIPSKRLDAVPYATQCVNCLTNP